MPQHLLMVILRCNFLEDMVIAAKVHAVGLLELILDLHDHVEFLTSCQSKVCLPLPRNISY